MLVELLEAALLSCGTVLDDAGAVELVPDWLLLELLELGLFMSVLLDELAGADDWLAAGAAEFWSGVVAELDGVVLDDAALLWFD